MRRALLTILWLSIASAARGGSSVAVIVNPASGLSSIRRDTLVRIFLGKTTHLPNGQSVQPKDQAPGPVKATFYKAVVGYSLEEINDYWVREVYRGGRRPPDARQTKDDAAMKAWVAKNRDALGYVSRSALDDTVKELGVE